MKRTLPLAARYADEWNGVFLSPAEFGDRNARVDKLLKMEGRDPKELRRSLMVGTLFGRNEDEIAARIPTWIRGSYSSDELKQMGFLVGTGAEIRKQIDDYASAGAQRIMLQWLDLDDLDGLKMLAEGVLD